MAILGREVFDERRQPTKEIEVPEWGGSILLRKLSGAEVPKLTALATSAFDQQTGVLKDPALMTRMLALGLFWSWVNEQGGQVLVDREKDIERLTREPFELLSRLGDTINEWNGINKTATADAKKNSGPTQSDDSGII
jgi:hypothetical protein